MNTFEVCAVNFASALAAERSGAHRIELCTALDVGGLTPSPGMIQQAVKHLRTTQVHVLIRPREGNFCYTQAELAVMLEDIDFCKKAGAAGIVIGALTPDNQLDIPMMKAMQQAAGSMEVTCHRAIDFSENPFEALNTLMDLGFTRILSSGQAATAYQGRQTLKTMLQQAAGRITIMPGAGITAQNIRAIALETGATNFHFTAKKRIEQPAAALPGLENWYWESDADLIRETMAAIDNG